MGLAQNKKEAHTYYEKAAEGGHVKSWHNLGGIEFRSDNHLAAMRHFRLSASGGVKHSVGGLIACFEKGFLHHGDLAETLQAFYCASAEMKSEDRDEYIKHLKTTGKYKEEYDC